MAHQLNSDGVQLASHNSLQRPYFSSVSQREFSDVLNGKNFSIQATTYPNAATKERFVGRDVLKHGDQSGNRSKTPAKVPLISEDDFVALSLQALQGISSFIYNSDTIRQKQLHVCNFILLGRSATSLSKYQLAFSESYYIRLLVGSAQEAFSTLSSDRGQLAFGAALGDLLSLHDASVSTMKEKLHNEGRVSLSSLWTSVALHRSILSQLFRIIASAELLEAFQRVFDTSQHIFPKGNIDEKMNQFALLDLLIARYVKVHSWMSSSSNNIGWVILDSLLVHLEKARKMTSKTSSLSASNYRPSFSLKNVESRVHSASSSSRLSAVVDAEEVLSDSLAKVIVILFLVKRVSLPLLELLQRRLLCLESDFETATPASSSAAAAVKDSAPTTTSQNILGNISNYHGDKKRRESIKNGDVILFPPDTTASPHLNQSGHQSPSRNSSGSFTKKKRTSSTGSASTYDEDVMTWDTTDHKEDEGEGSVLQGTVVPSLLLALERAIIPIRLICHAGQVTHSSMLGFYKSSNDIPIYGNKVLRGAGLHGQGQGSFSVWTPNSNSVKEESEEADRRSIRDNNVLRACRDSTAQLLIPLNTADLDGLHLLVNSAIGRFTAIRAAVLSEINAWTNPEPLNIDHKALQHMMSLKFKKRGRLKLNGPSSPGVGVGVRLGEGLEGGDPVSPGPVSEGAVPSAGIDTSTEPGNPPQLADILITEVSDIATLSPVLEIGGSVNGGESGASGDADASALASLSALSTIALNRADSDDFDSSKQPDNILTAATRSDSGGVSCGGSSEGDLVASIPSIASLTLTVNAGVDLSNGGAASGSLGVTDPSVTRITNGYGDRLHVTVSDSVIVEGEGVRVVGAAAGGGSQDNPKVIESTAIEITESPTSSKPKGSSDVRALVLGQPEGDSESCEGACEAAVTNSPHSTTYVPPFPVVPPAPLSAPQRTDLSNLAYQLITPDMRSINREMRFRERATSTFSKGLILLAEADGIVFNPRSALTTTAASSSPSSSSSSSAIASSSSSSRHSMKQNRSSLVQAEEENNALMLLMQPMQAILDGTLLSAVSWQCRVLDQAALFASITSPSLIRSTHTDLDSISESRGIGGLQGKREKCNVQSLLWHIDSFEGSFLLSSKSDVISSLVAIVIETYAHRHPFSHSQSVFSTQRSRYLGNIRRKSMQSSTACSSADARDLDNPKVRSTGSSVYTVESTASTLDLWTPFSLTAALAKLKNQRAETAHSLTYVQYTIKPLSNSYHRDDGAGDTSPRATPPSSSSSGPSSDSIFSAYGLERLSLSYTAAWPIDTMITPALLEVTARSTRRLIELAQLTALVRFVWVDTRGRKNCTAVALKHGANSRATKGVAPPPRAPSSHSSSSRAVFDRDCAHALRIVQQTLLPLSDFTSDRIKSQQIKFRTDVLDSSNHGFPGLKRAFMRYAHAVALSIFANCDVEESEGVRDEENDGHDRNSGYDVNDGAVLSPGRGRMSEIGREKEREKRREQEGIKSYSMAGSSSRVGSRSRSGSVSGTVSGVVSGLASRAGSGTGLRAGSGIAVDGAESDDFSIAELISRVLAACRDVLIMLEMSSIQESEENQRKSIGPAGLLFDSIAPSGLKPAKQTQMLSKIKDCMSILFQRRSELFLTAKRVAEDEDQQDAVALLMFFNQ